MKIRTYLSCVIMMNILGCSITDKAPSNQKSINSFLKDTDKGIVKPGERYVCAGFEKNEVVSKENSPASLLEGLVNQRKTTAKFKLVKKIRFL